MEDMFFFNKYIGGLFINMVIGMVWLGLKFGLIICVGDEYMGWYICEELECYGVDIIGVVIDKECLMVLVFLGICD